MPIYDLKCPCCDHRFEEFAAASRRDQIPCPICATAPVETDVSKWAGRRLPTAARRFAGSEGTSLRFSFHPDEVEEARRELPNSTITDGGDLVFESTGAIRAFERDVDRLQQRTRAQEEREAAEEAANPPAPEKSRNEREESAAIDEPQMAL